MVNINHIMKQAQAMQQKVAAMQAEQEKKEYHGSAGGGLVQLTISGKGYLKSVKLDQSLFDKEEVQMLEDLLIASFNDAKKKLDEDTEGSLSGIMGGMPTGLKNIF